MSLGRILVLDGAIQFSENRLNDAYTVGIVDKVVKMNVDYETVLIIGGGDLIIAAHLL